MSVKIRLAVTGKKNQIAYRIVASDTRTKRDGKTLEILGFYNPTSNAVDKLHIEKDKIDSWVKKGAIVTPAVALLIEKGTLDRPKKPKVKKEETAPAAPLAPAPEQAQSTPAEPETQPAEKLAEEKVEAEEPKEPAAQEPETPAEEPKPEPAAEETK